MKRCAVIGAGGGGLSAAIHLAALGFEVDVFEKNDFPGGKIREIRSGGYRFDCGPTLLTLPDVLDDLFDFAGFYLEDYLEITPLETICRTFFHDGSFIDTKPDMAEMQSEISRISPYDSKIYPRYMEYSKTIYDQSAEVFLFEPFHEVRYLIRDNKIPSALTIFKLDAFRTVHEANSSFFEDPRIIQLFDRYATYNGSSPYMAPATLNIIPHVEYDLGGFYPRGGMYMITKALVELAEKSGVKIHLNSEVDKILVENDSAYGLSISGNKKRYDFIISNCDVVTTFNKMIDKKPRVTSKLNELEPSISGMVFLWGVEETHDNLKHHNVIFSENYKKEFSQIFNEKKVPDDPTIYIAISSKSDPGDAPEGCENWYVLLNMPYMNGQDWKMETARMRKTVLEKLKKFGIDIEDKIKYEKTFNPVDFFEDYYSNKGSIYGISSNSKMTAFRRPANRNRKINNLYFCGGSSHPGGGVPLVLLSGKHCATIIYNQLKYSKAKNK